MAKQQKTQNTGNVNTGGFDNKLVEDVKDYHLEPNSWTQARNAVNFSNIGDLGDLGNEPANSFCARAPYTIIGAIHLEANRWTIFSTNGTDSEIGEFLDGECTYTRIVNARCLNFSTAHLIIGVSRELHDCTWQIYWDDGLNPSRSMNLDNVPWIQIPTVLNDCITYTDTTDLNCDKILLAPLIQNPCFSVKEGATGGSLLNGSYYVVAAYVINQQKIGDYSMPSNIQALFHHRDLSGSLDIEVLNMDPNFEEFELVLVSIYNQQTSARKVGIYSTRQTRITIDLIDNRWPSVPIEFIPIRTAVPDKSDGIFSVGEYMIRTGPTDKFDFNYQPLANQIGTKWVAVEYPADYYRKGGNVTSYLRDEVYPFFIRWVFNTGDKSADFHIPGRGAFPSDLTVYVGQDAQIEVAAGIFPPYTWIVKNTATITSLAVVPQGDGGTQIAEGLMGYWESSEIYDDDKPGIWNANIPGHPEWDLCGQPIRHHRFPDNITAGSTLTNHYAPALPFPAPPTPTPIRVMGVKFENIQPPVDNAGNVITSIVGYEILRGTREGNKSVIAKGMINNMFKYTIEGNITNRTGLYPNYPYNDLGPDPYLSTTDVSYEPPTNPYVGYNPITNYSREHFTFHSPDTQFKNPFLAAKELKIYGQIKGDVEGSFVYPDKHPKHKFITDQAFIISVLAGVGLAMIASNGKRTTTKLTPSTINLGGSGTFLGPAGAGSFAQPGFLGIPDANAAGIAAVSAYTGIVAGTDVTFYDAGLFLLDQMVTSGVLTQAAYDAAIAGAASLVTIAPGTIGASTQNTEEVSAYGEVPAVMRVLQGAPTFFHYFTEGVDATMRLIQAVFPYRQHALQYQSHCLYDEFENPFLDNQRHSIIEGNYLDDQIQDFGFNYRINNLFRGRSVALQTTPIVDSTGDNSKFTLMNIANNMAPIQTPPLPDIHKTPLVPLKSRAASHYVALKQRIRNQYGQIESIIQVPATTCPIPVNQTTSPIVFGGDTYIGRYTEKNTMFFFFDWLLNQPDGAAINYHLQKMIPFPAFWMDTEEYDFNEFITSITGLPALIIADPSFGTAMSSIVTPSDKHCFDRNGVGPALALTVKNAYIYLFNSGVRDFFVESEVNTELRDWGDNDTERHYDWGRYTDLQSLFNSSIIKAGNYFRYDYSLSISRLFNNFISWGNTHLRSYDPLVAEQCYTYRPDRVLYSLPQQLENTKDYWRVFLPNNYKDFKSRVTTVKPINKNGALFLFVNESPIQFLGVDQLETDAGTKITIGDGGLFSQPMQNILNADEPYEYGSCQNRLSVVNTPAGVFWMSQNQGKIFQLSGGIKEISLLDMKWWLASYLPYMLTVNFPTFELTDNPVIGIGCQAIYDNENQMVYFCKRDFELRMDIQDVVTYVNEDNFLVNGIVPIKLGDPAYFRKASWTLSFDPKTNNWISYHDWHPNLLLPGKNTFLSILNDGIWLHNYVCNQYCNYYGVDYPFEVEYQLSTGQEVNTLRSVQYQMEVYKYAPNCFDRYHVLDFNFDEAVIYNTEQVSGLLRLNLSPKNNPWGILAYPIINPTFIDILFSKVEQKYRIDQFWDVTDDRGEYTTAERMIWNTEPNGYIKTLNPINLNYNKDPFQRKKFRHYTNVVLLRRLVSGDKKMIVMITNNKNLYSPR